MKDANHQESRHGPVFPKLVMRILYISIFFVFACATVLGQESGRHFFSFQGPNGAGYMDEEGNIVIPSEGVAMVYENDKCGYIDHTGKSVISSKFERCSDFSDGLAGVQQITKINGKPDLLWGYIDKSGNTRIDPQFRIITLFQSGVALVYVESKRFILDKSGRKIPIN